MTVQGGGGNATAPGRPDGGYGVGGDCGSYAPFCAGGGGGWYVPLAASVCAYGGVVVGGGWYVHRRDRAHIMCVWSAREVFEAVAPSLKHLKYGCRSGDSICIDPTSTL
jgi:hypothetical protein